LKHTQLNQGVVEFQLFQRTWQPAVNFFAQALFATRITELFGFEHAEPIGMCPQQLAKTLRTGKNAAQNARGLWRAGFQIRASRGVSQQFEVLPGTPRIGACRNTVAQKAVGHGQNYFANFSKPTGVAGRSCLPPSRVNRPYQNPKPYIIWQSRMSGPAL